MKIIDEKGKIFGRINIIDLLVLLIVFIAAAGVAWKFALSPLINEVADNKAQMITTIRIKGASDYMIEQLKNSSPVGKKLVSGTEYLPDTNVEAIEFRDYETQVTTADGRIVIATDETRQDIYITLSSYVTKGSLILKIGNQEIRVGRTMTFKVDDFETYANIIGVEVLE